MALPVSPVVPGLEPYEINFGGPYSNQPQYLPMPALRSSKAMGHRVMSRWTLTDEERAQIANGADLYLTQLTFGHEFQPSVIIVADSKNIDGNETREGFELDDELNERLANL